MSPGKETIAFVNRAVKKLPANKRPDDIGKWLRNIAGTLAFLLGLAILAYQVLTHQKFEGWTDAIPAGPPSLPGCSCSTPNTPLTPSRRGGSPIPGVDHCRDGVVFYGP